MGSLSIWHWLIVLLVVVLIFGTKKLRNIGQDLGGAVKGFKEGVKGANDDADAAKTAAGAEASPPPKEKVDHYRLDTSVDKDRADRIAQTPRNQVVRYYNEKRRSLRVSEASLREFTTDCPVRWSSDAEKPREFRRLDHLLAAVKRYPTLFAAR